MLIYGGLDVASINDFTLGTSFLVFSRLRAHSASAYSNHLVTQAGFLSLSTIDIVAWIVLCCEGSSRAFGDF